MLHLLYQMIALWLSHFVKYIIFKSEIHENNLFKGDDNVIICKLLEDKGFVQHAFNKMKSAPSYLVPYKKSIGISNVKISFINGILTCSFDRIKKNPGVAGYYDLNNQYYLLLAKGKTVNGKKILIYMSAKFISIIIYEFR